jgi:DNA-binding transcriptional MerR regulator
MPEERDDRRDEPEDRDYRVDELAREAGTTVRNVRAYQDRGLLPAPRREGRVGLYSSAHLARLRLIGELLEKGYTQANIAELLAGWEKGQDLAALLGFEAALGTSWTDEPVSVTVDELLELFSSGNEEADLEDLAEALRLGLLEGEGERFRAPNRSALEVAGVLVAAGVPLRATLAAGQRLQEDVDDIATQFVDLVDAHVFAQLEPPPAGDLPRLAELVRRLRSLSRAVVEAEFSRALERQIRARFGQRLGQYAQSTGEETSEAS